MDIVEWLREKAKGFFKPTSTRLKEAADEIERLREQERKMTNHALERMEEIERLRWALKRISICEGGDVTVIWKEMRDIAIEALDKKDSE